MSRPVVLAYHLVWTGYGHWLPNDPRGSGSTEVHAPQIAELGPMHLGRKKWQPSGGVIRDFYERAKEVLKYPVLTFSFDEFAIVGAAFADVIRAQRYTCYACAAMPDHVHILIRKHKHKAEEMSERLKDASRDALLGQGVAAPDHPIWTVGGWHKFLDHPDDIRHDIEYIRNNPAERGLPDQLWSFVQAYDGWPHHARS